MSKKNILTKKQKETMDFLLDFENKNGYIPTMLDVKNYFNLKGASTAWERVKKAKNNMKFCPLCKKEKQ